MIAASPILPVPAEKLREPDEVMRLSRMGSFHQTRLSFMRILLRRLKRENWRFELVLWEIGDDGVGRAVLTAHGPQRSYSLVAFSHDLPDEMRTDRVIATAWDATFCLFDGIPDETDLARLERNVPLQEAGRISASELSLSRANRSARVWDIVVASLAQGRQPDAALIAKTGYLMRTTAVYGSGKFGASDHAAIRGRPEFAAPFQAEMLSVYLTRWFVIELANHMARVQGGNMAVRLDGDISRSLGIGNSTGLGMAPFLVNHPALLHAWIAARETALARVRCIKMAGRAQTQALRSVARRAELLVLQWETENDFQQAKLTGLRRDMAMIRDKLETDILEQAFPYDGLFNWAQESLGEEGQEMLVSLLLEPHGDLVDDLSDAMSSDEEAHFRIDGSRSTGWMKRAIDSGYEWALGNGEVETRFWYVSQAKLEPRLGERDEDEGAELELPLCVARDVAALYRDLVAAGEDESLARFLLAHPQHRHAARRVQISADHRYSEIRENLLTSAVTPVDMLRCKLSFFGATRFDPRSDRWLRIAMFQNAPLPHELAGSDDCWPLPQDPQKSDAGH